MFENVGQKIKKVSVIFFGVTVIASFIATFVFIGSIPYPYGFEDYWYIIFLPVVGSFLALISAWCLYGFGDLIDNISEIKTRLCLNQTVPESSKIPSNETAIVDSDEDTSTKNTCVVPIRLEKSNRFECPKCGCRLRQGEKQCLCFSLLDWSQYE